MKDSLDFLFQFFNIFFFSLKLMICKISSLSMCQAKAASTHTLYLTDVCRRYQQKIHEKDSLHDSSVVVVVVVVAVAALYGRGISKKVLRERRSLLNS